MSSCGCHSQSARGKEEDVPGPRAGLEVHCVQCWSRGLCFVIVRREETG